MAETVDVQTPLIPDLQNFAQDIFDTVREPLLVLDIASRRSAVSRKSSAGFAQCWSCSPSVFSCLSSCPPMWQSPSRASTPRITFSEASCFGRQHN